MIDDPDERKMEQSTTSRADLRAWQAISVADGFEIDAVIDPTDFQRWLRGLTRCLTSGYDRRTGAVHRHMMSRVQGG